MQSNRFSSGNIDHLETIALRDDHIHLPPLPTLPPASRPTFRNINYYTSTSYEAALQEKLSNQADLVKQAVIYGTAGSGKTVLAEQFLAGYQREHPEHLTYKLLAETKEQWESSLRTYAETLYLRLHEVLKAEKSPEKQNQLIVQTIQNALREKAWCILIDNWDIKHGPLLHEVEQIFCLGNGTLLITTQACPETKKAYSLDLSFGFSQDESSELLLKVMDCKTELEVSWEVLGNKTELHTLTQALNCLPLALVLAGSYLLWENKGQQEKGEVYFTFKDYQVMLDVKVATLVEQYDKQLGDRGDIPRDITREEFIRIKTQEMAVDLSLQKAIYLTSSQPYILLWQVLCLCSFLSSDGIPQQLLKDYLQQLLGKTEEKFDQVLGAVRNYSLMQFENNYSAADNLFSLHMHRVIQKVLKENYWPDLIKLQNKVYISPLFQDERFLQESAIRMDMLSAFQIPFADALEKTDAMKIRAYLPHIEVWASYWKGSLSIVIIEQACLLENLANAYLFLGDYRKAEALYRGSLEITITYYGTKRHVNVIENQQNLASVLVLLGRLNEAESLYRKALHSAKKCKDANKDTRISGILQNLAVVVRSLDRYEEAKLLCEKALILRKVVNKNTNQHQIITKAQQNLACIWQATGRYADAELLYREALAVTINYHNTRVHIEVADILNDLASVLEKLERYSEAETLYRESLETAIAHYKKKSHIRVAETQHNLAIVLEKLGRHLEAEALYSEALETKTLFYGTTNHLEVADTQLSLANVLKILEDDTKMENLYREALETILTHHDNKENRLSLAITEYNFSYFFFTIEKFYEACELLEKCTHIFEKHPQGSQYLPKCQLLERKLIVAILNEEMCEALSVGNYEEAMTLSEQIMRFPPISGLIFHNIACVYLISGIQTNLEVYFEKSQHAFEQSLDIQKSICTQIEYANFLRIRKNYTQALILLETVLVADINNLEGLTYNIGETPALPYPLAQKIHTDGQITIDHPVMFAHYLKIVCLLELASSEPNIISTSLNSLINFVNTFRDTHAEDFLPLYDWFLQNARELIENPKIISLTLEKYIDFPETWLQGCHILFKYGYRFLLERSENSLKIERIDRHNEEGIHRHLLENARSCTFYAATTLNLNSISPKNENYFTLSGDHHSITKAFDTLKSISNKTHVIMKNTEKEIDTFCRIS